MIETVTNRAHSRAILADRGVIQEVAVTVTEAPIEIAWADLIKACRLEPDDVPETPWREDDAYSHTVTQAYGETDHLRRGYVRYSEHIGRFNGPSVVELSSDWETNEGAYLRKHYRDLGASKQVVAEKAAEAKRRMLDQLVEWYTRGWEWWCAVCEFGGHVESLGMIDTDDDKYILGDVYPELAEEVASALEDEGHVITGRPSREKLFRGQTYATFREELRTNVKKFNTRGRK